MSTQTHGTHETAARPRTGGTIFASVYLALAGVLGVIFGIAALENKEYFNSDGLVWANLHAWGWLAIILGLFEIIVAGFIYARNAFGIVLGTFLAAIAFIANFLSLGAYPAWSVIGLVLDGLVIWALCVNLVDAGR